MVVADRVITHLADALDGSIVATRALGVDPRRARVFVHTAHGREEVDRLLVCAGADTPTLVRALGIELPVHFACHARLVFRRRGEWRGAPLRCWIDRRRLLGVQVYGVPVDGDHYAVGFGGSHLDVPLGDGASTLTPAGSALVDERMGLLRRYVELALPGLHPEPVAAKLCLTTTLPGGGDHFAAWRAGDRVVAFAGNNLFKFAPLLGRELARIVEGADVPHYMRP